MPKAKGSKKFVIYDESDGTFIKLNEADTSPVKTINPKEAHLFYESSAKNAMNMTYKSLLKKPVVLEQSNIPGKKDIPTVEKVSAKKFYVIQDEADGMFVGLNMGSPFKTQVLNEAHLFKGTTVKNACVSPCGKLLTKPVILESNIPPKTSVDSLKVKEEHETKIEMKAVLPINEQKIPKQNKLPSQDKEILQIEEYINPIEEFPEEISDLPMQEKIENFCNVLVEAVHDFDKSISGAMFFELADNSKKQLEKALVNIDMERQDILHVMELSTFNACEGWKLTMRMKEVSQRRRNIKDSIEMIDSCMKFYMSIHLKENTKKFRGYNFRVIKDLKIRTPKKSVLLKKA